MGAVRAVLSGYTYFPEDALIALQENAKAASEEQVQVAALTDRELSVLRLLARGGQPEIARDLLISHKTVSTYRVRLMQAQRIEHGRAGGAGQAQRRGLSSGGLPQSGLLTRSSCASSACVAASTAAMAARSACREAAPPGTRPAGLSRHRRAALP